METIDKRITESQMRRVNMLIQSQTSPESRTCMIKEAMLWAIDPYASAPPEAIGLARRATQGIRPSVYVKRRTADALEAILLNAGSPVDYDDAIQSLLDVGCRICENPRLYYKTLMIVIAQNPVRLFAENGKVGLVAWRNRQVA